MSLYVAGNARTTLFLPARVINPGPQPRQCFGAGAGGGTGGGVVGGRTIGTTDSEGGVITDFGWSGNRSIRMEDIAATIYSALGIDWTKGITDTPSGRKFEYVPHGATGDYFPINEVFG